MPGATGRKAVQITELLHAIGLGLAALGLFLGLVAQRPGWVGAGLSLMILLPPIRLATTIIGEARAHRYGVAAFGIPVLVFVLFSRWLS
jgi:hypothetical protein